MNQFHPYALPSPYYMYAFYPPIINVYEKADILEESYDINYNYGQINKNQNKNDREKERVNKRLSTFSPNCSIAYYWIIKQFGESIKHEQLRYVAQDIAERKRLTLDRDAKRRKTVLLKWFDENWEHIFPVFQEYSIDGEVIMCKHKIISSSQRKAVQQSRPSRVAHLLSYRH